MIFIYKPVLLSFSDRSLKSREAFAKAFVSDYEWLIKNEIVFSVSHICWPDLLTNIVFGYYGTVFDFEINIENENHATILEMYRNEP